MIAGEVITVKVKITDIKTRRSWKQRMIVTELMATDGNDVLQAIWFRQKFVGQILKSGDEIYLSGKPQLKNHLWQFINPAYEKVKLETIHSAGIIPIYHLTGKLTQRQLRFLMSLALKNSLYVDDPLPVDLLNQEKFPWLHEAYRLFISPKIPKNSKTLRDD